jgi:hypothetical protein
MKRIILFFSILLMFFPIGCDKSKNSELSQEKKLELKEKCSKCGETYFHDFQRSSDSQHQYAWDEPEYHYSHRLNTCLIHIRFIYSMDSKVSMHYNQIIDIFSNKIILYGWFTRDIEKNTEEVFDTSHSNIPNYTSTEYFKQKDKLFSE